MYFTLKESKITAWWVAQKHHVSKFVNICAQKETMEDLVVVGYMKDDFHLATSTNTVKEVTKYGVITSKGTFYPFEEANKLYILFLLHANTTNGIIASNWQLDNNVMTADIEKNGRITKNVSFDFESLYENDDVVFGYSEKLDSEIVVSTFSRRGYCWIFYIPADVKAGKNTMFATKQEQHICINQIKEFIK